MAPVVPDPKKIKAFKTAAAFETWLRANHARETEIWLRIYKKGSGKPSISVGEALGETLQVFAAGLAAGLVMAAIAVRATATVVGDLLFGVTATDTATVAGAALVMLLVASAACLLPARRAVSIDPLAAIRDQS